ncbi:superoxide dismutase, Cu-Zn family [Thermomonospora echinospora]|uniref:Superoxide dismutase, Cu-Zn family n=1 Tax=Thermomonospora echinospora TaxID=1992 RepID=A0A1H5ZZV4_9ACTN|nr:hypothetical protein [Thermomonospora echinospora]SEG41504.1 superoxide dismutase, Cu-Zn family [Thermomonospora echinospora]
MPFVRHAALAAALAGAVAVPAVPALAEQAPRVITATGPTYVYDRAYQSVRTTVQAGETGNGSWVVLEATGFPSTAVGKTFGAHVHTNKCGARPEDAGPHYQDPRTPRNASLSTREVWLDFTVGPDRVGRAAAVRGWKIPKGAANSIVIHAHSTNPWTGDAGGRLMCQTVPFGDSRR